MILLFYIARKTHLFSMRFRLRYLSFSATGLRPRSDGLAGFLGFLRGCGHLVAIGLALTATANSVHRLKSSRYLLRFARNDAIASGCEDGVRALPEHQARPRARW